MTSNLDKIAKLSRVHLSSKEKEEITKAIKRMSLGVKSYTDLVSFFKGGKHLLEVGITGSGKSTLLFLFNFLFLKQGYKIVYRDDTGLEFLYFIKFLNDNGFEDLPINIYYPEGTIFKIFEKWTNVYLDEYNYLDVEALVRDILTQPQNSFNVILFDKYNPYPELSASFWSEFFLQFILQISDMPFTSKQKTLLSLDELNDLVQSNQNALSDMHSKLRGLFEYNLRKVRKHLVTILATTHRISMMSRNTTSQFSYFIIKRSMGSDVYDFLNRQLIAMSNKTFWAILHDIITLPPSTFYIFDYKGNFDKLQYPDILKKVRNKEIKFRALGRIKREDKKAIELWDVKVLLMRLNGYTYQQISDYLKIPIRTIRDHYEKLLSHKDILEWVMSINIHKVPKKMRQERRAKKVVATP